MVWRASTRNRYVLLKIVRPRPYFCSLQCAGGSIGIGANNAKKKKGK